MRLSDCTPGLGVIYRPYPGAPGEDGTVVRCSDTYAFVLFVGDRTPKACRPGDLEVIAPTTKENP